ncbi:hypothetical protein ACFWYW_46865 [Nonomuraea sp. NPDC059023]|uniref:hypothetical protein n=1 Tax=unclassified Nonomuraea TaxID=2593643 RepID=UPI003695DFAA
MQPLTPEDEPAHAFQLGDPVELVVRGTIGEVDRRDPHRYGIRRGQGRSGYFTYCRTDDPHITLRPAPAAFDPLDHATTFTFHRTGSDTETYEVSRLRSGAWWIQRIDATKAIHDLYQHDGTWISVLALPHEPSEREHLRFDCDTALRIAHQLANAPACTASDDGACENCGTPYDACQDTVRLTYEPCCPTCSKRDTHFPPPACTCPPQHQQFPMDPPHDPATCPLGRVQVFTLPRRSTDG